MIVDEGTLGRFGEVTNEGIYFLNGVIVIPAGWNGVENGNATGLHALHHHFLEVCLVGFRNLVSLDVIGANHDDGKFGTLASEHRACRFQELTDFPA